MKAFLRRARTGSTSVLYKYITTYALILVLPFMVLGLFVFSKAIQQIGERYLEIQRNKLAQSIQDFDSQIAALPKLAYRIQQTSNVFLPYYWKLNKYNHVYTMWELDKVRQYSPILGECILVYREENTAFSSSSYGELDRFFGSMIELRGASDLHREILTSDIPTLNYALVRDKTANKVYDALVYVYPFKLSSVTRNNMAMVCLIPRERFLERMDQTMGNADRALFLYLDDQKVYDCGNPPILPQERIDAFRKGSADYLQENRSGHIVSLFHSTSAKYRLDYVMEVPWDMPVQQVSEFRKLFFVISAITLFIGLLLVFLFSYYNYRPLRSMLDRLVKQQADPLAAAEKNEYAQLDQAIRSTVSRNAALQKHINEQSQRFMQEMLSALLTGAVQHESLNHSFLIQPAIPGPSYCVLAIHAAKGEELDALLQSASAVFAQAQVKTTPLAMPQYQCVAVILNLESNAVMEEPMAQANRLCQALKGQRETYIGVSRVHPHINGLSQCMVEALLALYDILDTLSPGVRNYCDSLDSMTQLTFMPQAATHALKESIKKGNKEQAIADMKSILSLIHQRRNPVVVKVLYYDIANTILRFFNEMCLNSKSLEVDFLQLFHDTNLFQRNMEIIIGEWCDIVSRERSGAEPDQFTAILRYIHAHCLDYDLSLEQISEQFRISVPVLSKTFKMHLQIGFKEYLVKKRLESAKQMLCSTKMPVGEIAAAVGYSSESHFISVFKKLEKTTPAMYRRQMKPANSP